ncbi:HupE/UreJ family protein [Mycoplana dimorpha]|nr:HupE/UreJ family protein [Mycoplana dimorpha]
MSKYGIRALLATAVVLLPGLAMAHTGHGETAGLAHGFAHPLGGLDHVLAMIMVGVLAARLGGRALWLVPASFVAVMAISGAVGLALSDLPIVELGIALSVVALGAVIAFNLKATVAAAMALVGFFAVFHGAAHGAEMPETVDGFAYGAGFIAATALLHAAGIAGGLLLGRNDGATGAALVRGLGGSASLAGLGLLTGLL